MKMRLIVIDEMEVLVEAIKRKVVVLSALDRDEGWEINDQIRTMFSLQTSLEQALTRSKKILGA
jgi:hypothetical protein